jgi:hypothetical protein
MNYQYKSMKLVDYPMLARITVMIYDLLRNAPPWKRGKLQADRRVTISTIFKWLSEVVTQ